MLAKGRWSLRETEEVRAERERVKDLRKADRRKEVPVAGDSDRQATAPTTAPPAKRRMPRHPGAHLGQVILSRADPPSAASHDT